MREQLRVKRGENEFLARSTGNFVIPSRLRMTTISALFNIYRNVKWILVVGDNLVETCRLTNFNYGEIGKNLSNIWLKIGYNPIDNAVIDFSLDIKIICASNIGFLKNSALKLGVNLKDVEWFS
jgi:hypothetical protein